MPQQRIKPPSYRRHKASGQAIVTLSGKDFYLGLYGTKVSKSEYDRLVGEWMANGRTLTQHAATSQTAGPSIAELLNAFRKADVIPPSHEDAYQAVMKFMARLYGLTPAAEFGPLALKVVRAEMVAAGWKRRTVNQRVHNVRRIFRWGVEHQMVTPDVLAALKAVEALKSGRTTAPESTEIQPVAEAHVEACAAFMPPTVAAMVRLQMHTGMRAGELCQMTTGDIDTSDKTCWVYRPGQHKNLHRGKLREIAIGPKAVEILQPMLLPDLAAFIFSPARADAERRAARTAARKTPPGPGRNAPGTNRVHRPKRMPGARYDTNSYRRAIEYATQQAFPPPPELQRKPSENDAAWRTRLGPKEWAKVREHQKAHHWSTHQLRHAFGTLVGNAFSAEHAMKALGHSNLKATQIYAKLSLDKAKEVARAIG